MSDKIVNINSAKREVSDIITYCKDIEFEEILIVGIKDNKVYLRNSGYKDITNIVGELELLKDHILKEW